MVYFLMGALVFALGVLLGAAINQSSYNRVFNSNIEGDNGS